MCPQPNKLLGKITGDEDCLKLNVFVPDVEDKRLPVMFFVHGGGFAIGDGHETLYGARKLLERDVVLVTVEYRLGPLGALNLGDDVLAGNQAMWDQRLGGCGDAAAIADSVAVIIGADVAAMWCCFRAAAAILLLLLQYCCRSNTSAASTILLLQQHSPATVMQLLPHCWCCFHIVAAVNLLLLLLQCCCC
jgi:hypothetical protein